MRVFLILPTVLTERSRLPWGIRQFSVTPLAKKECSPQDKEKSWPPPPLSHRAMLGLFHFGMNVRPELVRAFPASIPAHSVPKDWGRNRRSLLNRIGRIPSPPL